MTGTFINVAAILVGTGIGVGFGVRLVERFQRRVIVGLGLVVLVLGIDLALAWRDTEPIYVLGGIMLGGLLGEALRIEERLESLGDRLQARFASAVDGHSTVSEGFVTATLLFCVGPLALIGSLEDGLTGTYDTLGTKAVLDGFAAIALAATLGWGVALSGAAVLLYQGALTLGAHSLVDVLQEGSEPFLVLTSVGGVIVVGLGLKLLGVVDVKVGNFLPALAIGPALYGVASAF